MNGLTLQDVKLDNSPSVGGKIGMWITAPRKILGIDVGLEVDVTNFNPDASSGQALSSNVGPGTLLATLDLNATYFGINVLTRVPMGVTPELPNGRWLPYIGLGGGGQRLTFQAPGTNEGRDTAPAFQGLGGVKVFVTKHIAAFAEGKFIHASHSLKVEGGGSVDLALNSVHGLVGCPFTSECGRKKRRPPEDVERGGFGCRSFGVADLGRHKPVTIQLIKGQKRNSNAKTN